MLKGNIICAYYSTVVFIATFSRRYLNHTILNAATGKHSNLCWAGAGVAVEKKDLDGARVHYIIIIIFPLPNNSARFDSIHRRVFKYTDSAGL